MRTTPLRWLWLLGLIGLVGFATGDHGFFGFFGFFAFLSFWRADERDTANMGRAGLTAFATTTALAALAIAAMPLLGRQRQALSLDVGDLYAISVLAIAGILAAGSLSFVISYHYHDVRGEEL